MINVTGLWNPKQALLKELIAKPEQFDEAIALCLEMHAQVHTSEMSKSKNKTFEDEIWDGLDDKTFRIMPTKKDVTIAWNLWHLTRIEDLTANILIINDVQVFNTGNWAEKLNITIYDTGNAMTDPEIIDFSKVVDMKELRNYRIEVGKKTRQIIKQLKPNDLKQKVDPKRLKRIYDEGGVVDDSKWLLDFWGRKRIAGILLMPITRHQIVHINDSLKLKAKCKKLIKN